jgi:hypothetical protein
MLKYIILFLIFALVACNETNNLSDSNHGIDNNITIPRNVIHDPDDDGKDEPDRHWCWDADRCKLPPYDCFPDITVEDTKLPFINELDQLISVNNIDEFFEDGGNYVKLYPGMHGPALFDLRDSLTTLRKVIHAQDTICYRIVSYSDTNTSPDYSSYYGW